MSISSKQIYQELTSCKILRKRINCFLKSSKSSNITLRIDSFIALILSSGEPFESRVNCGDGRFDDVRRWKLSNERGLSEPALLCCTRERFKRRVARAGRCDLKRKKIFSLFLEIWNEARD